MAATLAQIDAALFAALQALQIDTTTGVTDTKPFALVARYAGDWSPDGVASVCAAQYPACLLRWDDEAATRTDDVGGYGTEDRGRSGWTVAVVLEEPRGIDDAVAGATGVPGALTLVGQVIGACNALFVDGLWFGRGVRYVRTAPLRELIRRGVAYGYGVAFEALRAVEAAAAPTESTQDLLGIDADVNLAGGADAPPDPFEQLSADTTEP